MKPAKVAISIFGENYTLSGNPELIRRAQDVFREALARVEKDTQAKEVSTHRLAVMAALALASELILLREEGKNRRELLGSARNQLSDLLNLIDRNA